MFHTPHNKNMSTDTTIQLLDTTQSSPLADADGTEHGWDDEHGWCDREVEYEWDEEPDYAQGDDDTEYEWYDDEDEDEDY